MKTNTTHTPTPWKHKRDLIRSANDFYIAKTAGITDQEAWNNAAFIVRAVNAFDDMKEALLKLHPRNFHASNINNEESDIQNCDICQAITKAESQQ